MNRLRNKIEDIYARVINGIAIRYSPMDLIWLIAFQFKKHQPNYCIGSQQSLKHFKVWVISLEFRLDRRDYIIQHFLERQIEFNFFSAYHGKSKMNSVDDEVQTSRNAEKYLSTGSLGCIISHRNLWRKLINSETDCFLVCEDDIHLNVSYPQLQHAFGKIPPDFDIAYLGSGSSKFLNCKKINNSLYVPYSIRKGAYGYFISKTGAQKLLTFTNKVTITRGGVDTLIGVCTMRKKLNTYHFSPQLCEVNFSFSSNIRNSSLNKIIHNQEL